MGIKVTLYDFFAYTIPGGFYIATFVYFGMVVGIIPVDFELIDNLILTQIVGVTILAYVLGLILDPISRPWYYRFFNKHFNRESLEGVNSSSDVKITSGPQNWMVLLMFIRNQEHSTSDGVERYNATAIMLRNVSLCLLLSSVTTLILVFRSHFYIWNIVVCMALFCLSILAAREAARFHRWFYQAIYATIAAYGSKPSDFTAKKKKRISTVKTEAKP